MIEGLYLFLKFIVLATVAFIFSDYLSEKVRIPVYTIFLAIFIIIGKILPLNFSFLTPNYDIVYNIFLPLILFDSALRIDIHQLKLQAKTVGFLTTFGLILNSIVIAALLFLLLKIPFGYSLIFGALISATDPIGVLALFEKINVPRRLKLLIEGESMFNDAAAIVFYELLIAILFATAYEKNHFVILGEHIFLKFFVSAAVGAILGIGFALIGRSLRKDIKVINSLLLFFVLLIFETSEMLKLSAPIVVIMMGIFYSNFSFPFYKTTDIQKKRHYFSILAFWINIYFFSMVGTNISSSNFFSEISLIQTLVVILIVLVARSIAVYTTFAITNKSRAFLDEPDIYKSWQHIINVGGVRGIIPLILVDVLPEKFAYKTTFEVFTYSVFVFTNLVNASLVPFIIKKYIGLFFSEVIDVARKVKLLYKKIAQEKHLKKDLKLVKDKQSWFVNYLKISLEKNLKDIQNIISSLTILPNKTVEKGIHYLSAKLEWQSHLKRYKEGLLDYYSLLSLKAELDLQKDALVYPEKFATRVVDEKGFIKQKNPSLRLKFLKYLKKVWYKILKKDMNTIVKEEVLVYLARIISSVKVIEYIEELLEHKKVKESKLSQTLEKVIKSHLFFIEYNINKLEAYYNKYPYIFTSTDTPAGSSK